MTFFWRALCISTALVTISDAVNLRAQVLSRNHDEKPSGGSQTRGVFAPVSVPGPEPSAPPLLSAEIEGINFDTDGALNGGFRFIPPDPHGAAGSNHLVSVVNCAIAVHTKAGTLVSSNRLGRISGSAAGSFFEPLGPTNALFDAKVIYDQYSGRFVVVALEVQDTSDGDPADTSRILVAVSASDDPTGTWFFSAYNSKLMIGPSRWADYPGVAIDEEALYITANMFSFGMTASFGGSRLWIINKQSIYTNGTPVFAVYDPSALASLGDDAFTLQPAHVFGAGGVPSGAGTFLINSGWIDGSGNDFLSVIRVDSPLSSPTFGNQFVGLGNIHNGAVAFPDAPQKGTNVLIDTGDDRVLHAVWRNDNLYAVNTVNPPSGTDAGQATVHWCRIITTNLSALVLAEQGDIGGEDITNATHTYWPSIAVDWRGNVGIGFAASGTNLYGSAYYTGRHTNDPLNTMQTPSLLAAGQDHYIRKFAGSRNRWGDYSGISVDPLTDAIFWVFNEYAMTRGTVISGEDGRWATRWGSFTFNTNPVAIPNTIARGGTNGVKVSKSSLLANDTDPDGDTLSVASVSSTSTNGGTVTIIGSWVFYTPPAGYTGVDSFTYTISDGRGGTYTTNIYVQVPVDTAQSQNSKITVGASTTTVRFYGIPGRTYLVQFAEAVPTNTWFTLTSLTANALGIFEYVDTNGPPARYYRSIQP